MNAADKKFLAEVAREVKSARKQFPDSEGTLAALVEEVGEAAKAILDEPWYAVRAELVQVAAMALRLADEGDTSLKSIRYKRVHGSGDRYLRKRFIMPGGLK